PRWTMKRMLAMLMTASLATACGRGALSVTTPTDTNSAANAGSGTASAYAIGGMVQSIEKPIRGVGGALIEVSQGANVGKFTISDDGGAFAMFGLTPGTAV